MEKKLFVVAMREKKLRAAEHSSGPPWISNGVSLMQKIGKFLLFYLKANQSQIYRKI